MSDPKRLIEAIDDVDEIYSYIKGDYFDEKWGLGEKAERVKGLLLAYRDLLANSERVEWCEIHGASFVAEIGGCGAEQPPNCRTVPKLLVEPEEER